MPSLVCGLRVTPCDFKEEGQAGRKGRPLPLVFSPLQGTGSRPLPPSAHAPSGFRVLCMSLRPLRLGLGVGAMGLHKMSQA